MRSARRPRLAWWPWRGHAAACKNRENAASRSSPSVRKNCRSAKKPPPPVVTQMTWSLLLLDNVATQQVFADNNGAEKAEQCNQQGSLKKHPAVDGNTEDHQNRQPVDI